MGDALIYLGAVSGALAALGVVLRFLVVKPIKSWITTQVAPVHKQVRPNGGPQDTTRHLLEQTASDSAETLKRLDDLSEQTRENHRLATTALAIAQDVGARLDRHLIDGHPTN